MKIRDISGESNLLALIIAGMAILLYGFMILWNGDLWGGLFLILLGIAQLCVATKIWRKLKCRK